MTVLKISETLLTCFSVALERTMPHARVTAMAEPMENRPTHPFRRDAAEGANVGVTTLPVINYETALAELDTLTPIWHLQNEA